MTITVKNKEIYYELGMKLTESELNLLRCACENYVGTVYPDKELSQTLRLFIGAFETGGCLCRKQC